MGEVKKQNYIDRSVLRLNRKYGKDDLVKHLNALIKERDYKIGVLTSDLHELEYKLKHSKDVNFYKNEIGKTEMYQKLKNRFNKLKEDYDSLLSKYAREQLKNKK